MSFTPHIVLICALQFADFLRLCFSPRTTSRTISFSIPIVFGINLIPFFDICSVRRQYYPSMRAGPPNPGSRSAATRAGMKSGSARIRGVSIVVPTCKPAKLRRAARTDFCGKLQPARNRFSFCGPPECNRGPAGGTSRRKIVRIYCRPEHAALVGACPTNSCEVVRVTGTLKNVLFCTRVAL